MTIEEVLSDLKYKDLDLELEVKKWEAWVIGKGAMLTVMSLRSWLDRSLTRGQDWPKARAGEALETLRRLKEQRPEPRRDIPRWAEQEDIRKANEEREFLAHCTPEQLSEWRKKHGHE